MLMQITRISRVPNLIKAHKMDWKTFKKEASYKAELSEPTLSKAWNGDTDLTLETWEKLAQFFGVTLDEVLEIKY